LLQVKDTGCGISPQDLPHAFTKFAQPQNATSKWHSSNGLGLALSRRCTSETFFHMQLPWDYFISSTDDTSELSGVSDLLLSCKGTFGSKAKA
jgi:hypothetical protein